MKIKEYSWKNYKSYGSPVQTIRFKDKGELALVVAPIGHGKSAMLSVLDLLTFGEEVNKRGTRLPLKNIPNRTNGDFWAELKFSSGDYDIYVERSIEGMSGPLKTKMVENGITNNKPSKINERIQEIIGMDFKTFKSFVSLNVNLFKNFISLSAEEKRMLLDKLFNLEIINELNKIFKQLQKNNEISFNSINREISIYHDNIVSLEKTISDAIETSKIKKQVSHDKIKTDKENRLNDLRKFLADNKDAFIALEEQKTKLENNIADTQAIINDLNMKSRDINKDIGFINEKIDLYKSGKCPTCLTALTGDLNLMPEYEERLAKTLEIKQQIANTVNDNTVTLNDNKNLFREASKAYDELFDKLNDVKYEMKTLKTDIAKLNESTETEDETDEIDLFKQNLDQLKSKLSTKEFEFIETQKMKTVYSLLTPLWGESGIKRDIIDNILAPINAFIKEDLHKIKTRFKVQVDDNFDAHVTEYGVEIDPETLSTGEEKKVNTVIMLAYIKMIRLKKEINLLCLDEVFASIDIESIEDALYLFKDFANTNNINIILVHHAELKEHFFDRIIKVNKTAFSWLEEKQIT